MSFASVRWSLSLGGQGLPRSILARLTPRDPPSGPLAGSRWARTPPFPASQTHCPPREQTGPESHWGWWLFSSEALLTGGKAVRGETAPAGLGKVSAALI